MNHIQKSYTNEYSFTHHQSSLMKPRSHLWLWGTLLFCHAWTIGLLYSAPLLTLEAELRVNGSWVCGGTLLLWQRGGLHYRKQHSILGKSKWKVMLTFGQSANRTSVFSIIIQETWLFTTHRKRKLQAAVSFFFVVGQVSQSGAVDSVMEQFMRKKPSQCFPSSVTTQLCFHCSSNIALHAEVR